MDADKRRLMAAKRRKKRKDKLATPVRSAGPTGQADLHRGTQTFIRAICSDKKSHRFAKRTQCCFVRVFLCESVAES